MNFMNYSEIHLIFLCEEPVFHDDAFYNSKVDFLIKVNLKVNNKH